MNVLYYIGENKNNPNNLNVDEKEILKNNLTTLSQHVIL
tara:strand:+ start:243 stop:359 length:117 start_codon:yes stop_codon:yes gene_type:complete